MVREFVYDVFHGSFNCTIPWVKNVFVIIFTYPNMSESNSNHHLIQLNSDSEESSEISGIPQLQKQSTSAAEQKVLPSREYVRVLNPNEKIDEEGILEFLKKEREEMDQFKQASKQNKKKKNTKVPSTPSKKHDLNNIRKKWKAEMDNYITKYKEFLKQQKTTLDGKQKEYLLEFYKVLLDGIYELKQLSEDSHNDLTSNERKIIAKDADFHLYLKELVDKFNKAFRQAKFSHKISQIKHKWDPLIKNCKDQANLELRRKIIRAKIKPEHVLAQNDEFLMSEDAKIKQEHRRRLILNEAEKNFDKPLQASEEGEMEIQQNPEINQLPDLIDSFRTISSHDNLQRRINQEKEKLEEYKQSVGDDPLIIVKKRINEVLANTSSYERIINDFQIKFPSI